EAAGKRNVTRDARALFAERLFGDLDDDILTGLEHFGNELRAARRARAPTLIAAVAAMMSATTRAALEASAGTTTAMIATSTVTTAIAATVSTIAAASAAVPPTMASAAAIGALETRARIAAADARGIARCKFFARSAGRPRRTSLAGEQDRIIFMRVSGSFTGGRDRFGLEFAFVMI